MNGESGAERGEPERQRRKVPRDLINLMWMGM
jgi:hypothetical protein